MLAQAQVDAQAADGLSVAAKVVHAVLFIAEGDMRTQTHELLDQGLVADARTDECDLFALDQLCELLLFFLHKNRTSSIKCFCNKLLLLFILHLFRTIRNAQPAQDAKMH